ncbi:hypothetical protein ACFLZX_03150 [Nanoarchaeota archaeon]
MSIINRSKIKEYATLNDKPLNVSSEFINALESKTAEIIKDSCKRARANGRNTLMEKDL